MELINIISYSSRDFFNYHPITNDPILLESISYIESYTSELETYTNEFLKNRIFKDMKSPSIFCYDFMVSNDLSYVTAEDIPFYDIIIEYTIFNPLYNVDRVTLGLRLLYLSPKYFDVLCREKLEKITHKLTKYSRSDDEILSTLSIKCLQVAAFIFVKKSYQFHGAVDLFQSLIQNLNKLFIIEFNDEQKICEEMLIDPSLDSDYLNFQYFEIYQYGATKHILNTDYQQFHHLALMHYLIPLLDIHHFLKNNCFMHLLYTCIDIYFSKNENIISLGLLIISDCVENYQFFDKFLHSNGIQGICNIPYSLSCPAITLLILAKISRKVYFMRQIINHDSNLLKTTLKYAMENHPESNIESYYEFMTNSLGISDFYDEFLNVGGIFKIFQMIKYSDWFIKLKSDLCPTAPISKLVHESRRNILSYYVKIVLCNIVIQLFSIIPSNLVNLVSPHAKNEVNYTLYSIILKYFKKIGGINCCIDLFENLLGKEVFGILVVFMKHSCEYRISDSNFTTYKDLMLVFEFLSLYFKYKNIFLKKFDRDIQKVTIRDNLIHKMSCLFNLDTKNNCYYELIPYKIYVNLLISCFSSFNVYKSFIRSMTMQKNIGTVLNENSKKLITTLIENGIIHHSIEFITFPRISEEIILTKIFGIKCLMILMLENHVFQMIYTMRYYIVEGFQKAFFIANLSNCDEHLVSKFSKYISRFLLRVGFQLNKSNISGTFISPKIININDTQINFGTNQNALRHDVEFHKNEAANSKDCNTANFTIRRDNLDEFKIDAREKKSQHNLLTQDIGFTKMIDKRVTDYFLKWPIKAQSSGAFRKKIHTLNNLNLVPRSSKLIYKHYSYKFTYNKFLNCKTYTCNTSKQINSAKFMIDDNLVVSDDRKLFSLSNRSKNFHNPRNTTFYLNDSQNGELVIGEGMDSRKGNRFAYVWKYSHDSSKKNNPKQYFEHVSNVEIPKNGKHLIGMDKYFHIFMFDTDQGKVITEFKNKRLTNLPRVNSLDVDEFENLILSNGDLYCIRSGELLHSFPRFSVHVSGVILTQKLQILINSEIWDMRNYRLLDKITNMNNISIKRSHNDDILFGYSIKNDYNIYSLRDHYYYWRTFQPWLGKSLYIYDTIFFSTLNEMKFDSNLTFAAFSRDTTKIVIGMMDSTELDSDTFKVIDIGCESNINFNVVLPYPK